MPLTEPVSSQRQSQARRHRLFKANERFRLDSDSPLPLYHQMEQIILDRITKERAVGWMLPREMDLVNIFGVSRATVKKTTEILAAKGLIERKRAIGTTVVRLAVSEDLGRLSSYTEQIESRGLRTSTQVLSVKTHLPMLLDRQRLKLAEGEKTLCIRRLRGTSEVFPVVLLQSEIPARFGVRPAEDFNASLYRLLEETYRIRIEWAEERISASNASEEEARLLNIKTGSTVLVMERITYTTNDQPLELVRAVYRPEHYTFTVKLKR